MKHHFQQTGSALIILIGVMLMVLLLGAAVVSMRSTASFTKPEINNSNKAFYLAESGKRFADFSFSQDKSYPQTYRLSGGDEFELAIHTQGIQSTGIIYQNSTFETIRNINGLPKSGLPCWNFDNASKPGEDSCGLNDGTLSGLPSPVVGRFGFGNALQCNGSGWMETPFKPIAEIGNGKEFSISFWAKPDNITTQQVVLGVSDGIYRFSVGITSAGKWFWAYGDKTQNTLINADTNWQKVTLVYTGKSASDQMTLYVSKCAIQEFESFNYGTSGSTSSLPTAITNLFVCAEHTSSGTPIVSLPFTGHVDDIKIYDRALIASDEVTFNCGLRCDANAMAYYSFNGDAKDQTVKGNHGKVNAATLTDDRFGCPGKAYLFNGSGDYIHVTDHNSLDLTSTGTIAAWIYINNFKDYAGIIHKGDKKDFMDEAYSLSFCKNGDDCQSDGLRRFRFAIVNSVKTELDSATLFDSGKWYHIAATWDNSALKLYVNGVLDNALTITGVVARDTSGGLNIGAKLNEDFDATVKNFPFNGRIDEVVIYNRALSADEIALLANADDS